MKSQEKKEVQIILRLNQFEARWLKKLMQNPFNETGDPSIEAPQDAEMREMFWKEISKYDL